MQLPICCFSFLFSKYIVCVYNVNACEIFLKSIKLKCDAYLLNLEYLNLQFLPQNIFVWKALTFLSSAQRLLSNSQPILFKFIMNNFSQVYFRIIVKFILNGTDFIKDRIIFYNCGQIKIYK